MAFHSNELFQTKNSILKMLDAPQVILRKEKEEERDHSSALASQYLTDVLFYIKRRPSSEQDMSGQFPPFAHNL